MVSSASSTSGPPGCCHYHVESAWQPGRLGRHAGLTFTVTVTVDSGGSRPGGPGLQVRLPAWATVTASSSGVIVFLRLTRARQAQ